ncbi:hypothetical protein FACS189494_03260 [Spirochaetia bacterium]|nr:hypothetical protein FACS189494_03260 [Spirochaetia bacterium]
MRLTADKNLHTVFLLQTARRFCVKKAETGELGAESCGENFLCVYPALFGKKLDYMGKAWENINL